MWMDPAISDAIPLFKAQNLVYAVLSFKNWA